MDYREANILAQTFGFALGTALSGLLLFLIYRSGGKNRGARFWFAACVLIANGAGLFKNLALLGDPNLNPVLEYRIRSIGFAAGALCPCGILSIWRSNAVTSLRRRAGSWIVLYSVISGSLIAVSVIAGTWATAQLIAIPGLNLLTAQNAVGNLAIYNGLLILIVGGMTLLPGTLRGPTDQIAIALMILGLLVCTAGAVASFFLPPPGTVAHLAQIGRFQGVILLVIGVFFYFSHFRAADVFAKIALRLILGGLLALGGALLLFGPIASATHNMPLPLATGTLLGVAILSGTILLYLRLGYWIDLLVERRVFGKRDPRQMMQEFRQQIGSLDSRTSLIASIQSAAVETLAMRPEEIQVEPGVPDHTAPPADLLIPIPSSSKPIRLAVSLQGERRTLLTTEIDLLHEIALHAGKRLNDLEREEERIERVRMEGHLSRQLVEAELRALRSQINPHFLFNSLNTIASLIPSEPDKAEKMTIRLSSIFRYVLIQSGRPFSSLHEEMEFLRTILEIEQIRFGERLSVTFEIDSAAEHLMIPSLILQPLVENAIKHGVTPKIGKSHILVGAQLHDNTIQIRIEDDGLGFRTDNDLDRRMRPHMTNGTGIGLQNVRERLSTLYGTAAALTLSDLASTGCRATLTIPIHGAKDANSSIARGR
ncbi:sensor histidine kinase [Terriglobus sp. 2YAB30_2]|uniref:sensor histidine kinase n=1 Tax=unclassified Terriglobus TaxID=2628988 RepID=UPI003F99C5DB